VCRRAAALVTLFSASNASRAAMRFKSYSISRLSQLQ
jgi:hypothetical protein